MKILMMVGALLSLNSCNTAIGIGRDTKEGYLWTKAKIQNASSGGSSNDSYDPSGAPVY